MITGYERITPSGLFGISAYSGFVSFTSAKCTARLPQTCPPAEKPHIKSFFPSILFSPACFLIHLTALETSLSGWSFKGTDIVMSVV